MFAFTTSNNNYYKEHIMVDKTTLTEEDIKLRFITPAIIEKG